MGSTKNTEEKLAGLQARWREFQERGPTVTKATIYDSQSHIYVDKKVHGKECGWGNGRNGRVRGAPGKSLDRVRRSIRREPGFDVHTTQEAEASLAWQAHQTKAEEEKRIAAWDEKKRAKQEKMAQKVEHAKLVQDEARHHEEQEAERVKEDNQTRVERIEAKYANIKSTKEAAAEQKVLNELKSRTYRQELPESCLPIQVPLDLDTCGLLAGQEFEVTGTWVGGPGWSFAIECSDGTSLMHFMLRHKDKSVLLNRSILVEGSSSWGEEKGKDKTRTHAGAHLQWSEAIKVAGPGVVQCGYSFAHGTPFKMGITVEKNQFLLMMNDEPVQWPHGGETALKKASRIVWDCRNAAHVDGPHWKFRSTVEKFHISKLVTYQSYMMHKVFKHVDEDSNESLDAEEIGEFNASHGLIIEASSHYTHRCQPHLTCVLVDTDANLTSPVCW
jgi:hypothetical protein